MSWRSRSALANLDAKIGALERRVHRLEHVRPPTEPPEPTHRALVRDRTPRCPICHIERARRRHESVCLWCGFVFSATLRIRKEK